MRLSHWQLPQVLAVGFPSGVGGALATMLLRRTAATMRRRTPAITGRHPIAVSMVVALWLRLIRLAMVRTAPLEQAAATIPAVILVDHQGVHRGRALERNRLVP